MSVASLGYIGFEVSDLGAWDSYLTGFLGLMPGRSNGTSARYRMDDRAFRLQIDEGKADDISFIGLEVETWEGMQALRGKLDKEGVKYAPASDNLKAERGVRDLIVLTDPAGLQVEIYVGATVLTSVPFNSPAGVSEYLTGEQGAGHVVLASEKIDEVRDFYTRLLGFRLSDTIGIAIAPDFTLTLEFYHCNPRHHTLALAPMPAPKRLHHFMVEMATMDDVGFAMDRIEKCGVKQTMTLGKHSNDRMISFYAATPSGFEVEVGTAGIAVHDEVWRVTHHEVTSMWGHKRCS
ncbi:VOC family protein [Parvibaculum sp.]|jgi:biphenyl-2,3-diol 1,2-dioxygenase|uniref:VOC family protein n=1 Tax=Parvibaculum sp. TaxID=2024848 RepID=UPI001B10CB8E|nr:VOC family protein [Parvibaculum sp.]MBO6632970.1 VOC family protein [Parvibaculum sp.]MBO6677750.1 VOC family protein [Parvibaculum sp.]MBO6684747.1 VOC family protein [Parvibaculum sp.]MBO6903329.1 VOC family protein [Parvibaculum sp.]